MKKIFGLLIISVIAVMGQTDKPLTTVKYVDLKKYAGTWYEIARIPNSFQDHCIKNTMAKYILDEKGKIKVINSCIDEDGEIDDVEGVAKVVDKTSNSKLEVSFVSFLGIRPFWGDYWIIGLGKDYDYAVIGSPGRKYGWILSRTKILNEEQINEVKLILKNNGYDFRKFATSKQE